MAENDISISEMTTGTFSSGALFPAIQPNQQNTYSNVKLSGADIGDGIGRLEFPLRLETENKSIFGAINEIAGNNSFVNYLPTDTASGAIARFTDGAEAIPVKSLTAEITPIQAGTGTPSPSNPRAISGRTEVNVMRTGANLWDEQWEVGSIDTTTGNNIADNNVIRSKNYIPCIPNTNYYCTANPYRYFVYDKNKNFIGTLEGTRAFTTPSNTFYVRFRLYSSYGTIYNNDIAFNYPSTDTTYSPYTGEVTTIDLGTTVYGGTLDVTRGKLTIDNSFLTVNSADMISKISNGIFRINKSYAPDGKFDTNSDDVFCDKFKSEYAVTMTDIIYRDANGFTIRSSGIETTVADFFANVGTFNIVYPLATPTEIDLTPEEVTTLLGENNIFADSGNVEVVYRADIQKYIDKKISEAATSGTRGAAVLSKSAPAAIENKEEDQEGEE